MYIECTFLYIWCAQLPYHIYVQKQALHVVQAFGGPCDSCALSAQFTHAYYTKRWQAAPPFHKDDGIGVAAFDARFTCNEHATNTYDSFGASPHVQGPFWLANNLPWIIRTIFENWTHIYCPSSSTICNCPKSFSEPLSKFDDLKPCMTLFSKLWRSDGKSGVSYSGCFSLPTGLWLPTPYGISCWVVKETRLILVGPMFFAR